MKTNAPGPFSCEIYIKSWELGYRHGSTKLHIDNCPFCGPIVHGGTEEFPLSAAEQAKVNIKERKRKARRQFFKKTAVAASLVAASIVGFDHFRNTAESVAPKTIQTEIAADFATLDAAYATLGRSKIEAFIGTDHAEVMKRVFLWIRSRAHNGMYDLICRGLSDRRVDVGLTALSTLRQISPIDLKPCLDVLTAEMTATQDQVLKSNISKLLTVIESS